LDTWVHVNPSLAIAFFQSSVLSSRETLIILNPFLWNSLYNAITFGFSSLHGWHHDAQKSIKVTLPRLSFNETIFPDGVGALKLGATVPTAGLTTFGLVFFLKHPDFVW
jgi:hypothetical protein